MIKCICRILKILLVVAAVCGMAYHGRIKEDFENYKMRAVPALMYHSISKRPAGWTEDLCVPPEVFEEHLKYLKEHGYTVVTARQATILLKSRQNVMNTVVLTFDDGYVDNYTQAFPLLKKYGFSGTFYIIGKDVGKTLDRNGTIQYMSFEQLKEMHRQGMEIGSHTRQRLSRITCHGRFISP